MVESTCAPFQSFCQFGQAPIAILNADPNATVFSTDGVGANDHVLRSSMMIDIAQRSRIEIVIFVRTYTHPTSYKWQNAVRVTHQVHQIEDCLAVHDVFFKEGEVLFAFRMTCALSVDRIALGRCLICWPTTAGILLHTGKTGCGTDLVSDLGCLADSRSVCRPEVPPVVKKLLPNQSIECAILHDVVFRSMKCLLGGWPGEPQEKNMLVALPLCPCEWESRVSGQGPGWFQQRGLPLWLTQLWPNWKLQQNLFVA